MKKTYSEKLKDPRWQKKRLQIFERDKFTCTGCGETKKTLHVHHALYLKNKDPWDYENDFLHTLCENCHSLRGEVEDAFKECLARLPTYIFINFKHQIDEFSKKYSFLSLIHLIRTAIEIESDSEEVKK